MYKPNRLPSEIKIPIFERGLIATYKSGSIMLTPAETIYFTVPTDLVELLHIKYGINLLNREKRKELTIWANLVEERSIPASPQAINTLTKTIEEIINIITTSPTAIEPILLEQIDQKIKNLITNITTPLQTLTQPQLRIVYEIERKPKK
jgi:hypothetical protein